MTTTAPSVATSNEPAVAIGPLAAIVRDIARGGLAGAVVGLVVAGLGGRVVMRLAAILVPSAAGAITENGNRIDELTLAGTAGLVLFGLIVGILATPVWVAVSPWLPRTVARRAAVMVPVALAIGARSLIEGGNPDFVTLRHDPLVVVSLLLLVAVFGAALALVDDVLDRRLPPPTRAVGTAYALLAAVGLVLVLPVTLVGFLSSPNRSTVLVGVALVVVGIVTLAAWVLRVRALPQPSWLTLAARAAVVIAMILGFAGEVPDVADALGS